jgi:glycosyltransferase involved in cell wall biosynthesis
MSAASRLRIVVSGSIAQYPLGGMTWHHLQYVLGLARLGHDVLYLEDTGAGPYDPAARTVVTEPAANVDYLARAMSRFGLEDRWAHCHLHGEWSGLPDARREQFLRSADLLLNVSGMLSRPDAYRAVPHLVYIDTDPVFNHAKLANGDVAFRRLVEAHDVHFSFGERLEAVPAGGIDWQPTRQPIVLSEWQAPPPRPDVFSTVMNWRARRKTGDHGGEKDVELLRFAELPQLVAPAVLELAVDAGKNGEAPLDFLSSKGWRLVDPRQACANLDDYRTYLGSAMAEWSVAKNGYVRARPGWFSERSACYLASGRPVVLQDTGFSAVLPVGEGIVPFTTLEEAAAGVNDVRERYGRHSEAAREIAAEWFDSDKVLSRLLAEAL